MPAWTESAWASPSGTSTLGSSSSPRAGDELAAWKLDDDIIQNAKTELKFNKLCKRQEGYFPNELFPSFVHIDCFLCL